MSTTSTLTFLAQLSLDFIFTGVEQWPADGEEVMADAFELQLGGGTLVYPIVLSRLGVKTRVVLKTAQTQQSQMALTLLKQYPIHDVIEYSAEGFDPIMSTAVISNKKDRSFISKNNEKAMTFEDELVRSSMANSKVVFATEKQGHLLEAFKSNGATIVFDVGWSEELSVEKYKEILHYVDYFTPNDKEAMKMTGTSSVEEALRVLSNYVRYPVVSCGGNGCMAMIDGQIYQVDVPGTFDAVDLTGAGDNFMAGLIYGIYKDYEPLKCLQLANCTGALSTTGMGCYGRAYSLNDVMECMAYYD